MTDEQLRPIEARIEHIKHELFTIGEMRPGSLTKQSRARKDRSYYQLSYTHKMKGRTEYVRSEFVAETKRQISTYKRFRGLVEEWTELAIQHAKMKVELVKGRELKAARNRDTVGVSK
jgi:hypothetical protein